MLVLHCKGIVSAKQKIPLNNGISVRGNKHGKYFKTLVKQSREAIPASLLQQK